MKRTVNGWWSAAMRRMKQRLRGTRLLANAPDGQSPYERFRAEHLSSRRALYPCKQQPGLLSLITTVWNTDVEYLRLLSNSVLEQRGGTLFEWVILDNGSVNPSTVQWLNDLGKYPCVRLHRTASNLGIIGGMRYCLERATGRYVVPVDSDDFLSPDCVGILTWYITRNGYPALLYTDEDKLAGQTFLDPYFKPDWDPVLFVDSCYIAHLCAISRERALALDVYTDRRTEGSHDGDTFMRFHLAGHEPFHVPEVVYSWRMHAESTAANMGSKNYIHESQKAVLARFLAEHPYGEGYTVEPSPFFAGTPDWWIKRHATAAPVGTIILSDTGPGDDPTRAGDQDSPCIALHTGDRVGSAAPMTREMAERGGLIRIIWSALQPDRHDSVMCAANIMELFPDTVMVGGPVHRRDGVVLAAGRYFGFGSGCESPDRGRSMSDPGYFAQMWKQHSVSAVSSQHAVIDARFFVSFLDHHRDMPISFPGLGAWAGAYARRLGKRVVYTPFMGASCEGDWDARISQREHAAFVSVNRQLIPEARYLSPRLGLTRDTAYLPVAPETRKAQVAALLAAAARVQNAGSMKVQSTG